MLTTDPYIYNGQTVNNTSYTTVSNSKDYTTRELETLGTIIEQNKDYAVIQTVNGNLNNEQSIRFNCPTKPNLPSEKVIVSVGVGGNVGVGDIGGESGFGNDYDEDGSYYTLSSIINNEFSFTEIKSDLFINEDFKNTIPEAYLNDLKLIFESAIISNCANPLTLNKCDIYYIYKALTDLVNYFIEFINGFGEELKTFLPEYKDNLISFVKTLKDITLKILDDPFGAINDFLELKNKFFKTIFNVITITKLVNQFFYDQREPLKQNYNWRLRANVAGKAYAKFIKFAASLGTDFLIGKVFTSVYDDLANVAKSASTFNISISRSIDGFTNSIIYLGGAQVPVYVNGAGRISGSAIAKALPLLTSNEIAKLGSIVTATKGVFSTKDGLKFFANTDDLKSIKETIKSCTSNGSVSKQYCQWIPDINELSYIAEGNKYLGKSIKISDNANVSSTVDILSNWKYTLSRNQKGIVFYDPAITSPDEIFGFIPGIKNKGIIRVANPTTQNPSGYVRKYSAKGQPLDINGNIGTNANSHFNKTN